MTKELKVSFALVAVFTAIIMAWKTLIGFFSGAGLNFVAILTLLVIMLLLMLQHEQVKKRTKDMFIVACVFAVLELIVYLPVEFGIKDYDVYRGFMVYQNVITFLGILFFAYISFRFLTEFRGVKIRFVEFILGNRTKNSTVKIVKEKKNKELENGSLEEKPNKAAEEAFKEETSEETEQVLETVEISEE